MSATPDTSTGPAAGPAAGDHSTSSSSTTSTTADAPADSDKPDQPVSSAAVPVRRAAARPAPLDLAADSKMAPAVEAVRNSAGTSPASGMPASRIPVAGARAAGSPAARIPADSVPATSGPTDAAPADTAPPNNAPSASPPELFESPTEAPTEGFRTPESAGAPRSIITAYSAADGASSSEEFPVRRQLAKAGTWESDLSSEINSAGARLMDGHGPIVESPESIFDRRDVPWMEDGRSGAGAGLGIKGGIGLGQGGGAGGKGTRFRARDLARGDAQSSVYFKLCFGEMGDGCDGDDLSARERGYFRGFSVDGGMLDCASGAVTDGGVGDWCTKSRVELLATLSGEFRAKVMVIANLMAMDVVRAQQQIINGKRRLC